MNSCCSVDVASPRLEDQDFVLDLSSFPDWPGRILSASWALNTQTLRCVLIRFPGTASSTPRQWGDILAVETPPGFEAKACPVHPVTSNKTCHLLRPLGKTVSVSCMRRASCIFLSSLISQGPWEVGRAGFISPVFKRRLLWLREVK